MVWHRNVDRPDPRDRRDFLGHMDPQKTRQDQMKAECVMNEDQKYVDITTYCRDEVSQLLHIADKSQVLLYMPYLDFKDMEWIEQCAKENGMQFLNIPITLPVMDIVKQSEYAGIEITSNFVSDVMIGVRNLIADTLNKGA